MDISLEINIVEIIEIMILLIAFRKNEPPRS
jgi:hypothetical protein